MTNTHYITKPNVTGGYLMEFVGGVFYEEYYGNKHYKTKKEKIYKNKLYKDDEFAKSKKIISWNT